MTSIGVYLWYTEDDIRLSYFYKTHGTTIPNIVHSKETS